MSKDVFVMNALSWQVRITCDFSYSFSRNSFSAVAHMGDCQLSGTAVGIDPPHTHSTRSAIVACTAADKFRRKSLAITQSFQLAIFISQSFSQSFPLNILQVAEKSFPSVQCCRTRTRWQRTTSILSKKKQERASLAGRKSLSLEDEEDWRNLSIREVKTVILVWRSADIDSQIRDRDGLKHPGCPQSQRCRMEAPRHFGPGKHNP
jgi:hypothetical protein